MHRSICRNFSLFVLALAAAGSQPLAATNYSIVTQADDLTVNGNCTLREALAAADTNFTFDLCPAGSPGGLDTITLAAGTYSLPLGSLVLESPQEIGVRGPETDPPSATISGGAAHRIFDLSGGGRLTLQDLEIRDGSELLTPQPIGGAVRAIAASLTVRRVRFVANVARRGGALGWVGTGPGHSLTVEASRFEQNEAQNPSLSDQAHGGAIWGLSAKGSGLRISDSSFVENRSSSALANDVVTGGALRLDSEGPGSSVVLERLRFLDNVAETTGSGSFPNAGALSAYLRETEIRIEDLYMEGNGLGFSPNSGYSALFLLIPSSSTATLDRVSLINNGSSSTGQGIVSAQSQSTVILRNALVVGGEDGLVAVATGDATLRLDHLTVAGHLGVGLDLGQGTGGSLLLENSIAYGNGIDLSIDSGAPTVSPENLVGTDPLFTDAAGGDFTLASGSPAVDAGNTASSSMGPYDLAHAARVVGAGTDLGAFERGGIFNDGFEAASAEAWNWPP
jgi:hypothetical protein